MAAEALGAAGDGGPAPEPGAAQDIGLPDVPGYRIEETLGRGSTGVVYRATQLAVEREVALKVLHPDLVGRPKAVRRLQREARTTARLTHPNIVSAIDLGRTAEGLWWYAMELVRGESLAERLRRSTSLSEREALRVFVPLVDALDHAFRNGVVHRDIKPANILIDERGRARLVDLGLAFREDDPLITGPGGTLGTPHYVSPEQARKPESADTRSDIWSLGATLYHAVCGRPPFAGQSVAEILSGVLYGRVRDPQELEPRLSRNLSLVLRKCLTRDPAGRYQKPSDLLADLEHLREREPVGVQVKALDPLERDPRARRRVILAASAGVLLLAALGLGLWLRAEPGAHEPVPDQAHWPELEELARSAAGPDTGLGAALVRLGDLGTPPARHRARFEELEEALLARWATALTAFAQRTSSEVDRLLDARDFERALVLVSAPGMAARAQAELAPDAGQLDAVVLRVGPDYLRRRVQEALESFAGDLGRRIEEHFREALFAAVANDLEAGNWARARGRLERTPGEYLADARIVTAGLPAARAAEFEQHVQTEIDARREHLDSQWRRQDQALVVWIEEQAGSLQRALTARSLTGAAEALTARYVQRLAELGVAPDQRLPAVSDSAPAALTRMVQELSDLERRLLAEDARSWLARQRKANAVLLAERRFGELREDWARALERDWLAPVRSEIELELEAVALQDDLLQRAARGISDLDGQSISLLIRSIEYRGRLEAGGDPLRLGFKLVPELGAPQALALRALEGRGVARPHVLPPEDVERFAGLPLEPDKAATARERLARALLRQAAGDTAGALRCLPIARGEDARIDALAERVEQELGRVQESDRVNLEQRETDARERLNLLLRAARDADEPGDAAGLARRLDALLVEFGDLETIRGRAVELRELRDGLLEPSLATPPPDLQAAYGPTSLELQGRNAQLFYDFGSSYAGPWSPGDWRADAESWCAPQPRSFENLHSDGGWPRLELVAPLDIDAALGLSLTFEQPQDSGPPRLLTVTLAGVHVLLRGSSASEPARVLVGSGGPEVLKNLLYEIDQGGKGRVFGGLARAERYTLAIALSQHRGKVIVNLSGRDAAGNRMDNLEIYRMNVARPEGKPDSAAVIVRSLEPLRLFEATLSGSERLR